MDGALIMSDTTVREIALELTALYGLGELEDFDVNNYARVKNKPLGDVTEAVKMAIGFLREDYW